jgi:hypothetical protein
VEEWRSSEEQCGVERRSFCPFIGRRGKGAEAMAWELAGRPLMAAAGGSVERPLRGGEGAEAAVGVRSALKAARWGGEGARGTGDGGTAGGQWRKKGGGGRRKKKVPTGGPHLSVTTSGRG